MTVAAAVEAAVSQLVNEYPTFPVHVTGHSLGAALSVLASVDIRQKLSVPVTVYNYGGEFNSFSLLIFRSKSWQSSVCPVL